MVGNESELQDPTTRLEEKARTYGMEVSSGKAEYLSTVPTRTPTLTSVNSTNQNTHIDICQQYQPEHPHWHHDERSEPWGSKLFQISWVHLKQRWHLNKGNKNKDSSGHVCYVKTNTIWKRRNISFKTKLKLYRALAVSILLYGCESWTLTAETERRIQTFETKCVRRQVDSLVGKQVSLLAILKRRKLSWFGHITRHNDKTILQSTLEGKRRRGRQRKNWLDNIQEWTHQDLPTLLTNLPAIIHCSGNIKLTLHNFGQHQHS